MIFFDFLYSKNIFWTTKAFGNQLVKYNFCNE